MTQFDLSLWLEDKSRKVVTRNGLEAEIIHYKSPVVAIINGTAYNFENDGSFKSNRNASHSYDLFFADEEKTNKILDELKSYLKNTPKEQVEKDWKEIQDWYNHYFTNEEHNEEEELTEFEKEVAEAYEWAKTTEREDFVNEFASKLLDLARKELEKDLPKWKKAKKDEELDCHVAIQQDDRVVLSDFVQKDEYYITLDALKKLPKKE